MLRAAQLRSVLFFERPSTISTLNILNILNPSTTSTFFPCFSLKQRQNNTPHVNT